MASASPAFMPLQNESIVGKNCAVGVPIFNITDFMVAPAPQKNHFAMLTMVGVMAQTETITTLDAFIKFDGVNFYQESFKQGATVDKDDECTVAVQFYMPGVAPSGDYSTVLKLKNDSGDYLCCWEYDFSLS